MALVFILAGVIAFDVAALFWGVDSRERFDSPEWARIVRWRELH